MDSTNDTDDQKSLWGLHEVITQLSTAENKITYEKNHKILGQGNMVFALSEGQRNGKHHTFYDLFFVKENKVFAHWNIINEIPEKAANDNGMF